MVTTSASGETVTLNCIIAGDTYQALLSKGVTITGFNVPYGVQTTALASIGTPTVGTIALPAPGASQTPSTVTPVTVGGTLTSSSTTSDLATTTAGAFYQLSVSLGTPLNLSTSNQAVVFTQPFTIGSGSATVSTLGPSITYTVQYD